MDYTALDLCLGKNGLDCVFEKWEHPEPTFCSHIPGQNLLVTFAPTVILRISLYPSTVTPSTI